MLNAQNASTKAKRVNTYTVQLLNAKVFLEIESPFVLFLACEQEMETLFVNEFSNASLRVLKHGDEKAISISSTWSSCELDRNHSWYFGCSDSRLSSSFYLDTMMNLFTLTKGDFYFNLKVRNCSSYASFVVVAVVVMLIWYDLR